MALFPYIIQVQRYRNIKYLRHAKRDITPEKFLSSKEERSRADRGAGSFLYYLACLTDLRERELDGGVIGVWSMKELGKEN